MSRHFTLTLYLRRQTNQVKLQKKTNCWTFMTFPKILTQKKTLCNQLESI